MYTEIVKIIEGGMLGDKEKVVNYATVLADNQKKKVKNRFLIRFEEFQQKGEGD